jgi:signal peptidase I
MKYKKNKYYIIYAFIFVILFGISKIPIISKFIIEYPYIVMVYWITLFVILITLPKLYVSGRVVMHSRIAFSAASGAFIFIAIKYVVGAILSQIKLSPYDLSLEGLFNTFISIIPILIAREKIREYAIAASWKKKKLWYFFVFFIVILLSDISLRNISQAKEKKDIVIYLAQYAVPAIMDSILLTTLSYYGGAISSISYILVKELFIHMFPYLPDLNWLAEAAIGIVFPAIYTMIMYETSQVLDGTRRVRDEKVTVGYVVGLFGTIMFSWFCVGVFPIYPSVILTGSMLPKIKPGDVILIQKPKNQEEIESFTKGTVINFYRDSIVITHRIVDIKKDEAGNIKFITKGDNNFSIDDDEVEISEVNGKYIAVIPKIGIPIMMTKKQSDIPEGVVDYGKKEETK